jgi:hypothetical protein
VQGKWCRASGAGRCAMAFAVSCLPSPRVQAARATATSRQLMLAFATIAVAILAFMYQQYLG